VQLRVDMDGHLEHGLAVVVAVDLQVVDDRDQGVDAECVVGDGRAQGVLEVDVQVVHAGWVVYVGHNLVGVHARLCLDGLAGLHVEPGEHGHVAPPQVPKRPEPHIRDHCQPMEGRVEPPSAPFQRL